MRDGTDYSSLNSSGSSSLSSSLSSSEYGLNISRSASAEKLRGSYGLQFRLGGISGTGSSLSVLSFDWAACLKLTTISCKDVSGPCKP